LHEHETFQCCDYYFNHLFVIRPVEMIEIIEREKVRADCEFV
jgi:hypothetical protein